MPIKTRLSRSSCAVSIFFLALVLTRTAAWAQTGAIAGVIADATGAPVPDAIVNARNMATTAVRTATTDGTGAYSVSNLIVGKHDVTVEKRGFTALRFQNIELTVVSWL